MSSGLYTFILATAPFSLPAMATASSVVIETTCLTLLPSLLVWRDETPNGSEALNQLMAECCLSLSKPVLGALPITRPSCASSPWLHSVYFVAFKFYIQTLFQTTKHWIWVLKWFVPQLAVVLHIAAFKNRWWSWLFIGITNKETSTLIGCAKWQIIGYLHVTNHKPRLKSMKDAIGEYFPSFAVLPTPNHPILWISCQIYVTITAYCGCTMLCFNILSIILPHSCCREGVIGSPAYHTCAPNIKLVLLLFITM